MTVADQVAQWLASRGVDYGFGIIGGGNFVLWDAITRLGKTKLICCHHEQAAVMAATYFQRTSGRIALTLVTTGAGSTNALTGVEAAYMDHIPVLVISGNEASKYMESPTRTLGVQGYDSSRTARQFCKAGVRMSAGFGIEWLDVWLQMALKPAQGPVWIDIPKDVQSETYREPSGTPGSDGKGRL